MGRCPIFLIVCFVWIVVSVLGLPMTSTGLPLELPIPAAPADVTPEWITAALRGGEPKPTGSITAVNVEPTGDAEGFAGQVVRLALTPAPGSANFPTSVIAKFPNSDPDRRALFHRLGYTQRELRFYRELAPVAKIGVPRLHFGSIDPASGDSVLLLEDLARSARLISSDWAASSVKDAERALRALARFHATWWDEAGPVTIDWVPRISAGADNFQARFATLWWPTFVREWADDVPELRSDTLDELGPRLSSGIAVLKRRLAEPPRTLVHQDFRPDNIFVSESSTAPFGVTVIDFENIARGRGSGDVVWFIASGMPVNARRAEGDLVDAYLDELRSNGIDWYDRQSWQRDFQLATLNGFATIVAAVTVNGMARSARARATAQSMLRGYVRLIQDHNMIEALR